jgi:ATP-dependent RNA helicase DeaD
VPSFEELHIQPAFAAALNRWGWIPDDPALRDAAPTAARGHNLVAVTPPAPVYTTPAVAGLLSRLEPGQPALIIVPPVQLDEWAALVRGLNQDGGLRVQVARGTARAMRQLRAGSVDVLVTTPESALTLVTRSALRMDTVQGFMLAWPESLLHEDSMMPLMQDLSKETQRIIYTSEPSRVGPLVERYARKALTIGGTAEVSPGGPVRVVSSSWSGRVQALAEVIELLDPASLIVWTADQSHHHAISRMITGDQPDVHLVTGDAPSATTIVAFDLPTVERLRQLLAVGEVVLLVPPGTESYVSRVAAPRRPLQLPGLLDAARSTESAQRQAISEVIQTGPAQRSVLTLAPLFERFEATAVAAALFELWTSSGQAVPPPASDAAATARVYVGAGKKDGVNANDLVAVLTKELRVDKSKIGRIELRDAYSLIELPAQEAEQLATQLNGVTIRRKRVTARVDRGPTRPPRNESPAARPARRADRR